MTWKTQPTTGHVRGATAPGARVDLISTTSSAIVRSIVADGKGWFAFVDVAPGAYRVNIGATNVGTTLVVAGGLASVTLPTATPAPTATPSLPSPSPTPSPTASPSPSTCTSSVGPGIPAPATVPSGVNGFHAAWYGQSGYPTLCAGQQSTAVVAYYNAGSRGWVSGRMGEVAYLGTWKPEPGQDAPSLLGGDGTVGTPNTSWPRYNRIALQPADYVGPSQVAWFQFTIQAPMTPGMYRLYLRPLVEGASWMEDYGVYWIVTVK